MADVKDGDIVFEYPDDDEIPGSKLPDEKEVELKETEVKTLPVAGLVLLKVTLTTSTTLPPVVFL